MKKIIRPEGPAKKINLLRYCPKKIFRPRPKSQLPPPPPPEYQMDRALPLSGLLPTYTEWIQHNLPGTNIFLKENYFLNNLTVHIFM